MTAASTPEPTPGDAELITATRGGSAAAYAELYDRHRAAAYNLARQLARSPAEADDLVSEAFARLLAMLRGGGGPESAFRAYLLTALRHCAYDRTRRERRLELSDDVSSYDPGIPFVDTAVAGLDRSLAARAFARLPERWQTVLWHTEIEDQSPAEVAPLLGLTPNGVSALAYRAREGLRQAYLQVHLADRALAGGSRRELARCRAASDRLGAWIRSGLSRRETAQVEHHLDECEPCRALAAELADVNGGLRAYVAPLVLGTAAASYLAASGAKAAATTTATATTAGGTAAALELVTAAPRQLLALGGSTAALAAAVVVGLVLGPAASVESQASPPSGGIRVPSSAPVRPAIQTTPTETPAPTVTSVPTATADGPALSRTPRFIGPAGRASLTAQGPAQPLTLDAGGAPSGMSIAVHNAGPGASEPVVLMLTLPAGISAAGTGTAGSATCTGGLASIRCATEAGLTPGGSTTFALDLAAAADALDGVVTGLVQGGEADVALQPIGITVRPAPKGLELRAWTQSESGWRARMQVRVTNAGRTSGTLVTTIALPDGVFVVRRVPGCTGSAATITCTAEVGPRQQANWGLTLGAVREVRSDATVAAVLGNARSSTTVPLRLDAPCQLRPGRAPNCPPGQHAGRSQVIGPQAHAL